MSRKRILLTALLCGFLFALPMSLFTAGPSFRAIFSGEVDLGQLLGRTLGFVIAGVLFGGIMGWVISRVARVHSIPGGERPAWFVDEEALLYQGPANHWRGAINYGGWLFLTNRRLRFEPHMLMQSQELQEWRLEDVVATALVRTLHLVPNGLRIDLRDGTREQFVVSLSQRSDWQNKLDDARGEAQHGPPPPAPA